MNLDDVGERANMIVGTWIIGRFRRGGENEHLRACESLVTESINGYDGSYGCDTGCEYARIEITVSCTHGQREDFSVGEFGELADMIDEIVKMEDRT